MNTTRRTFLAATLSLALVGCVTVSNPERILNKARGTAFIVTAELLKNHPDYRDGFVKASADLKFVAETEVLDTAKVFEIINRLPVLENGDISIFIQGAVLMFQDELSSLAVKNPEQVRMAAKGLYQGIDQALGFIVPKALKAP